LLIASPMCAGGFVRSNELKEGDFIVIYSDLKSGKYVMFFTASVLLLLLSFNLVCCYLDRHMNIFVDMQHWQSKVYATCMLLFE
jgi:hypothetical protein